MAVIVVVSIFAALGQRAGEVTPPAASGDLAVRADQVHDRYAAALADAEVPVSIPASQRLIQEGDWEPAIGESAKIASLTGHFVAAGALPPGPGTGELSFEDGQRVRAPIMDATTALATLTENRTDCQGCTDLRVTGATLVTALVPTEKGDVRMPAWRFDLEGTRVTLLVVALPSSSTAALQPMDPIEGSGLQPEGFVAPDDSRTLRINFTGSPDQPGPCGADYEARVFERDASVAVALFVVPREAPDGDVACNAIGALRSVDITLGQPLAGRPVLSVADGMPVPQGDPFQPR